MLTIEYWLEAFQVRRSSFYLREHILGTFICALIAEYGALVLTIYANVSNMVSCRTWVYGKVHSVLNEGIPMGSVTLLTPLCMPTFIRSGCIDWMENVRPSVKTACCGDVEGVKVIARDTSWPN